MSSVLFAKILPVFVMLLVFVWFWEGHFSKKLQLFKSNISLAFLPLLFFLFALGLFYSTNQTYGLEKMETRLSLLVIPIVLPSMISLNFAYNRRVFSKWYVRAAVFTALFCFFRALVLYIRHVYWLNSPMGEETDISSNFFFYSTLSQGIMHPGYLAMYANTALILCLYDIRLSQSTRRKLRRAFQAIVLVLFVVLLYSKAGLAAMSLIILAFAMRWAWFQKKWQVLALSFVGMIGFFAVIYFYVPNTQLRLQTILASQKIENHNPLSTESTQTRIHAWKAARKVIAEKPVFGHGTGDAMDVLFTKYDELGYVGVRTIEMNAHNEFYQTGIALGFVGMGVLIMVFISGIYISYRRRNFAVGLWSICMALAMAFESYLNTQAGVVLLALFMTYFSLFNCDDRKA